ncbi:hypothetical protein Bpfe_003527 [Biomphalaria pfeifferi]|uniref:Uncharacterized protein n=1 Tax=Biomphalaria pfeifferi TaxID=112525 RepID=A0AAD8C5D8_BIOPF|nr:hypothetical protein Bpfe_003527 [Biomphalaria pfeifferi]
MYKKLHFVSAMKDRKVYFICFHVLIFLVLKASTNSDNNRLTLYTFSQNNCVTSCTGGLRCPKDKVVLKGLIDTGKFTAQNKNLISLVIRKRSNPFTTFCSLAFYECEGYTTGNCYCKHFDSTKEIQFILNTTADLILSQTEVVLIVENDQTTAKSSPPMHLPKMYESSDITLEVNNLQITPDVKTFKVSTHEEGQITFCCHNTPTPCNVSITKDGQIVSSNITCTSYIQHPGQSNHYTFIYFVCNENKISFTLSAEDADSKVGQLLRIFHLLLYFFVAILVVIIYYS